MLSLVDIIQRPGPLGWGLEAKLRPSSVKNITAAKSKDVSDDDDDYMTKLWKKQSLPILRCYPKIPKKLKKYFASAKIRIGHLSNHIRRDDCLV
jgi:hypothetical protein